MIKVPCEPKTRIDVTLLCNEISRTVQATEQQLSLHPAAEGNQEALQSLVNIHIACKKNLALLKSHHNRLEGFHKEHNFWQSKICSLSKSLEFLKSFRQVTIFKKVLKNIDQGVAQLQPYNKEEVQLIEALEKTCKTISSNLEEKLKQPQINKGRDICICFTTENIDRFDDFAICGEAKDSVLFTYEEPVFISSSPFFSEEKCLIEVNWQNHIPSAKINKEFDLPKNSSNAFINPKILPYPEILLRLCSTSEDLKTASIKVAKITKDGKKFWMEGKNVAINFDAAILLSNSQTGFDLGKINFEATSAN